MASNIELVYVADPMCSWCWGFAPVIEKVESSFDMGFRIIIGGLRPGDRAEPIERIRGYLAHHWTQVASVSGQPFDHAGLERDDWMYDTLVPDTAVVTMREAAPHETRRFLDTVQRAFYSERVDVTDPEVYRDLVTDFPVDPDEFVTRIGSVEMRAATEQDFLEAQWLGVTGFPTLLMRDGASSLPISYGYAPFETVAGRINGLIDKYYPDDAAGLVCDLDGGVC
ncbi:MAG: DsbA family protein [Actinomycetota bacterium]